MTFLKSQLVRYVRSLPRGAQKDFERYLKSREAKAPGRETKSSTYWRELPIWLFNSYRNGQSGRDLSREFLNDIRWGQHCLFLAIRIQDDLFDGDTSSPALLYISDQFLIEADRTFSDKIVRSARFRDIYRSCLLKTTGSILAADEIQRKVSPDLRSLEDAYAGVNALFKIAPAAICSRAKRMRDYPFVSNFCDEMAVVGQVLDDMRDLGEDLACHRFNFVVSFFLRRRNTPVRRKQTPNDLVRDLLLNGSISELFQLLHHHVDLAEGALGKLHLPGAVRFLRRYRENLHHKEGHLNRRQVHFILNALV